MKLSSLLSDGLILQRDTENTIWGISNPDYDVFLKIKDSDDNCLFDFTVKADANGNFEFSIPPVKAGGPYDICLNDSEDEFVIHDVLFGDLFLLGGQSNMELPISRTLYFNEDYCKNISNLNIRHFEIPKEVEFKGPVADIYEGSWKKATQEHLYNFSALGLYFAEYVNENQNVPVGLLQTACGGIQIEALINEERLLKIAPILRKNAVARGESKEKNCVCGRNHSCKFCYEDVINNDKSDEYISNCMESESRENNEFYSNMDRNDIGLKKDFVHKKTLYYDGAEPKYIDVPGRWENHPSYNELNTLRGSVWLLKKVIIPQRCVGKKGRLYLGTIIDADETYINGVKIGNTDYRYPPRKYEIPEGLLEEENTIVVRVKVAQRTGGFVEEMPYYIKVDDTIIPVDGEYEYRIGYNLCDGLSKGEQIPNLSDSTFFLYRPVGMYNKMIYPLRKLRPKAFIFYQAESNCLYYKDYELLMRQMVEGIRELFDNEKLPLAYIQLPYFGQEDEDRGTTLWDDMRKVQAKCQDIPYSTMVYNYDLGSTYELHPQTKRELALRLYNSIKYLIY